MNRRHFALRLLAATALPSLPALPVLAQQRKPSATPALGRIEVSLLNAAPRFDQFYTVASQPNITDDQRFALWQQINDFLPPGDAAARRAALDAAWPRYAGLQGKVPAFTALQPAPTDMLGNIAGALRMEQALKIKFVGYVGLFDGQVLTQAAAADGSTPLTVFVPLEAYDNALALRLARALAAIVLANMGLAQSQAKSVAESVVYGGLARFAALAGDERFKAELRRPDDKAGRDALIKPLLPLLADTSPDTLARVSGGDNAAAQAGWWLAQRWAERGLSLAEMARTPQRDMVKVVRATLDSLLRK